MESSVPKSPTQVAVDLGKNFSKVPCLPQKGPTLGLQSPPILPMQKPDGPGEKLSQLPHQADEEIGPERGSNMPKATQGK